MSTSGSRRKFLKTIGSAAVVTALPRVVLGSQAPKASIAVFWEPGFPEIQGCKVTREILQQGLSSFTVHYLSEQALIARLNTDRFDLFLNPYGSAFPKRAWPAILKYLQAGGNWLNVGGVPLSRPVIRDGESWRAESHQTTYHKRLGITHSFPVKVAQTLVDVWGIIPGSLQTEEVYELYVRLSSTNNEPDEAGSDGPREGVLNTVMFAGTSGSASGSKSAPVIQIDRLLGEFAGGRWLLANYQGSIDHIGMGTLAFTASQGALLVETRTRFACYREGESPSLSVRVHRPKGGLEELLEGGWYARVEDSSGKTVWTGGARLKFEDSQATASIDIPRTIKFRPGFYTIQSNPPTKQNMVQYIAGTLPGIPISGFWFYDEALMRRGKPLTVDNHFFYRGGEVFPVTGTTYMASDVHRRFLFDPNPAVWDNDFRSMKYAGVNMIRTGIWTAWKKYMPAEGQVDESVLRAFDAFLLTAHKYDIPVIFTFFAFLPEAWGGANAYLDPRAVKAQQQFIEAFTKRYPKVDDVIWDFINEPSFCSPKHLWSCRPNYDEFEKAAWKQWLKDRYPAATDEERISHLQQLWRTTSDDVLELPQHKDFDSVNLIDDRQPLKTLDYRLFAQDMFIRWTRQMTQAVRSNGNLKQLITVGQDEAGLADSPNIQFFAREIDFTSLHNWWANDDLVWDSVLAKTPSKLSLMEETGVMFYEKPDADAPWRSEEDVSKLLERKMVISCTVDGAGFIEWVWNTNPYMNSTNEVGIGFHRVDRSWKPEFLSFIWVAQFMKATAYLLRERQPEPVVMVIPHSQMFSPRSFANEATRRCVRAMYYHCGVPLQAVSEYTIGDYALNAKLIVVPSPGVLTQKCWDALLAACRRGATVAISGVIDADDHGLAVERSGLFNVSARSESVSQSEVITIGGREHAVRFEGEKMQRIEKSVFADAAYIRVQPYGLGHFFWSPLPLELGDSMPALTAFYKLAFTQAGVAPLFKAEPHSPSVLVFPSVFRDIVLYTFISETDKDMKINVTHLETPAQFSVTVRAERTTMVILDRKSGTVLSRDYRSY